MKIKIADITCELNVKDNDLRHVLATRYDAFLASDEPLLRIVVAVEQEEGQLRRCVNRDVDFAEAPVVNVVLSERVLKIERLDNPFVAAVDTENGQGEVMLSDNQYCFDSFLRVLYSILLARSSGMLLHSAAIKLNGCGCVFVGGSGSGKTTLASLSSAPVLSDEFIAIRKFDDEYKIYSTPFLGEFKVGRTNTTVSLGNVYLLKKGLDNYVKPVSKSKALSELLSCIFFFGPKYLTSEVFTICTDFVEETNVEELYFLPTQAVFDFLQKGELQNV